jgi:hypothetical protein
MRIRLVASMIAAGSVIVLVGCGAGRGAPPEPIRPSPTQAASPIPPVKNPRDVAALARRPCELLTSQQAAGFGLDLPPKQYDAALGDLGCKWTTTTRERQTFRTVQVDTFTNNPTLEVAYGKRGAFPSLNSPRLLVTPLSYRERTQTFLFVTLMSSRRSVRASR